MSEKVASLNARRAADQAKREAQYRDWVVNNAATGHPGAVKAFQTQHQGGLRTFLRQAVTQVAALNQTSRPGLKIDDWLVEIRDGATEQGKTAAAAMANASLSWVAESDRQARQELEADAQQSLADFPEPIVDLMAFGMELTADEPGGSADRLQSYLKDVAERAASKGNEPAQTAIVSAKNELVQSQDRNSSMVEGQAIEAPSDGYKGFVGRDSGPDL